MIEPIVLTDSGETLVRLPSFTGGDEEKFNGLIGVHAICGGLLGTRQVSTAHQAIICRECYLRVLIPALVCTYAGLRRHFQPFQLATLREGIADWMEHSTGPA